MAHLSSAHWHIQRLRQRIGCSNVPNLYKCLQLATYQRDNPSRGHSSHSVPGPALLPAVQKVDVALQLLPQSRCHNTANTNSKACLHVLHRHNFSTHDAGLLFNYQLVRTVTNAGGARKVIDEQEKDEGKDKQKDGEPKSSDTKFDRSLKARKAKNTEHQSVIAHMSDVRTPRSLLKSSEKMKWEVVQITVLMHHRTDAHKDLHKS